MGRQFLLDWPPVICFIIGIPLLTMRLMSEEWSTGTYEMLMTVPVKESTVVLAKFFAAFLFFLLLWVPFGICLVALRVGRVSPLEALWLRRRLAAGKWCASCNCSFPAHPSPRSIPCGRYRPKHARHCR